MSEPEQFEILILGSGQGGRLLPGIWRDRAKSLPLTGSMNGSSRLRSRRPCDTGIGAPIRSHLVRSPMSEGSVSARCRHSKERRTSAEFAPKQAFVTRS
jgi:hypothetical protein